MNDKAITTTNKETNLFQEEYQEKFDGGLVKEDRNIEEELIVNQLAIFLSNLDRSVLLKTSTKELVAGFFDGLEQGAVNEVHEQI